MDLNNLGSRGDLAQEVLRRRFDPRPNTIPRTKLPVLVEGHFL